MNNERDLTKKNFGITDSRGRGVDMVTAVKFLAKEEVAKGNGSHSAWDARVSAVGEFQKWAIKHNENLKAQGETKQWCFVPTNNLKSITEQHMKAYAAHLKDKCEEDRMKPSTAQERISRINSVLHAGSKGNNTAHLDPVRGGGLPTKSGIATEYKGVPADQHKAAMAAFSKIGQGQIAVMREIGLRAQESLKFNAGKALAQIEKGSDKIRITDGTKGGRPRWVHLSNNPETREKQVEAIKKLASALKEAKAGTALRVAQKVAGKGVAGAHKTAVNAMYKVRPEGYRFHGERHYYANRSYFEKVGVMTPVQMGVTRGEQLKAVMEKHGCRLEEAKRLDAAARLEIARDLGHNRVAITRAYLG